jgi:GDPmannose 4,6-dehydratase
VQVFIHGITGQDGYYLTKKLLDLNVQVLGSTRTLNSTKSHVFIRQFPNVKLYQVNFSNFEDVNSLMAEIHFDFFVNLAGPSSVKESFENPSLTSKSILQPLKNVLNFASQRNRLDFHFIHASTSEVYGGLNQTLITEDQKIYPLNPYAMAKAEASKILKEIAEDASLKFSNLIMFNHESPLREEKFISQKIVRGMVQIKIGNADKLQVGKLDQLRDWSFAGDFMDAVVSIIQQKGFGEYILASGELHAIYEIAQISHKYLNISKDLSDILSFDPQEVRVVEPGAISGNSSKARSQLNWNPQINFEELVIMLVDSELKRIRFKD